MKIGKFHAVGWLLLIPLIAMTMACSKNVYDEDEYEKLVLLMQPVDTIDANHDWQLTNVYTITVDASAASVGAKSLQILSGNPVVGQSASILGQYAIADGKKKKITFVAPMKYTEFYAALVDTTGTYTLARFMPSDRTVGFTNTVATKVAINQRLLALQSFCYCFEENIPEPGDYDYNDIVLRISQERMSENQIVLNVTLAAVGTEEKIGAAIHLIDYYYNDIDSIVTTDGTTFDDGYEKQFPKMIEKDDLLLKGFGGEAIINVFEDCHWATGDALKNEYNILERRYYNVSKSASSEYGIVAPRTISYVITFKDATLLDHFSLNDIDPFIITEYNGSFWETHSQTEHRNDQMLHRYKQNLNVKILPWAMIIPNSGFRYPLQGVNIGFYKKNVLFGAYMTRGHSFGEWASDRHISQDWYDYPTSNQVF